MLYFMDRWYEELEGSHKFPPILHIAFEYDETEENFGFYIRKVENYPTNPTLIKQQSRALFFLVKGISRKTSVMGWTRTITSQEIEAKNPMKFQTLNVEKCYTTLFNEYFTANVAKKDFKNTLLRIQICDVDKNDQNVVVFEMDYWINTNIISQFTEFEFPFPPYTPDLGEIETNMVYLPTTQRLIIHYCNVTNLKLDENCKEIYIRAALFVDNKLLEIHRSEKRHITESASSEDGAYFTKKLLFDLNRTDALTAQLLIHVVQIVDNLRMIIGHVILSYDSSEQWRKILGSMRNSISQIHRLSPSAG